MSRIDELKSELNRLPLIDQVSILAELESNIAGHLNYDDANLQIAAQRLQAYRAGNMAAAPWSVVRKRLFAS